MISPSSKLDIRNGMCTLILFMGCPCSAHIDLVIARVRFNEMFELPHSLLVARGNVPSIINSVSYKFIGLWCTVSQLIRKKNPSYLLGLWQIKKNLLYSLGGCKYFPMFILSSGVFIFLYLIVQFVKGCQLSFFSFFNRFRHLSHCIWALVVNLLKFWRSNESISDQC